MEYLDELEMGQRDSEVLQSLCAKRDQLKLQLARLVSLEQELTANTKIQTSAGDGGGRTSAGDGGGRTSAGDVTDARSEQQLLMDTVQLYNLTGVAVQSDDNDALTVKFNPAYKGHHHSDDSYSVQYERRGDHYKLGHHNLPPFIPVQYFAEECLGTGETGLQKFICQLCQYLYLYTHRRGMVRDVQTEFGSCLLKGPDTNLAVTHVHMRLSPGNTMPDLSITLTYDLLKGHPESAEVKFETSMEEASRLTEEDKKMEEELRTRLLTEDLCSVLRYILGEPGC